MSTKIVSHEGSFPGLRVLRDGMPATGGSYEFLAFLAQNPQHLQAARGVVLDVDLQRLVSRCREDMTLAPAA